jgi:chromosomal replication initiation ATPase DnaA
MTLTTDQVIDIVSMHMELNVDDVMNKKTRKAEMVLCRHLIFYFMRKYVLSGNGYKPIEYDKIGKMFKKDHSTIIHAERKVKSYIAFNKKFRELVIKLEDYFSNVANHEVCVYCGCLKEA